LGYSFTIEDGRVVKKLAVMEKIDVQKKVVRETEHGDL
jgi:hypothetical protein